MTVSYPLEQDLADYADFTGQTAAVKSVDVRARVWGYLQSVNFTEGALVRKGDLLFQIDPRPYQALVNQAKAKIAQDQALLTNNEGVYRRTLSCAAAARPVRTRSTRPWPIGTASRPR